MGDIFFIIKVFILTGLVILFMQIKVGKETIEQKTENWVRSSVFVGQVQEVADGAVIVGKKLYQKVSAMIEEEKLKESFQRNDEPGRRLLGKGLKRSSAYLKDKAQQAKATLEEKVEDFQDEYVEEYIPLEGDSEE